jgi:hypothetical protein
MVAILLVFIFVKNLSSSYALLLKDISRTKLTALTQTVLAISPHHKLQVRGRMLQLFQNKFYTASF